jgi:hypothetical protein
MRQWAGIRRTCLVSVAGLLLVSCGGGADEPAGGGSSKAGSTSAPATTSSSAPTPSASPEELALAPFKADGFTVLMPGKPTREQQSVDSPVGKLTIVVYGSDTEDQAYLVSYYEKPKGAQTSLSGAVQGAANAVGGTVTDEASVRHRGFRARDARITTGRGADGLVATVFTRIIDADNRVYQLQYIQEGSDVKSPPANYPTFLNSLRFT